MRILHLYQDIMNLYGEYGNMVLLAQVLNTCGISTEVVTCDLWERPDFSEADFVYMGAGTEKNQKVVLTRLLEEKNLLQDYIFREGMALFTGNSFEILGAAIIDGEKKRWQGLNILPFIVNQQRECRLTGDAVFSTYGIKNEVVGFINKCSYIEGIQTPCFQVLMGMGNEKGGSYEGICYKNIIGTHLTGPLLVKNPYFLLELVNRLVKIERGESLSEEEREALEKGILAREIAAYNVTLRELKKRIQK